jgi:FtsP/CotA-like multicopper oxidase with cupredoxin domain
MLRACLIAITAVLVAISPRLMDGTGFHPFWFPAIWPGLLLVGLVFERIRYKDELSSPPGPDWVATEECTVDASGTVRVWYHPRTGGRAYVREQTGGPL